MECPRLHLARLGERGLYLFGYVIYKTYAEGASALPSAVAEASAAGINPTEVAEDIKTLNLFGDNYRTRWIRRCAELMYAYPEERDYYALGAVALLLGEYPGADVRLRLCYPEFYKTAASYFLRKWLICAAPS
ncbi:MAG: hypothetical protein ABWK05_04575, partial [Pyrobaculum sp.]